MTKNTATKKPDVYQAVTDAIVTALESGPDAWKQCWKAIGAGPRSALGHRYRGTNLWVLAATASLKGYPHHVWATYNQWKQVGAQVQKGEKSTTAILWKPYERTNDDTGEKERSVFARSFALFNIAQVDGAPQALTEPSAPRHLDGRDETAEVWIEATGATIDFGSDTAYYSPGVDRIALPHFEAFDSAVDYYAVAAHELVHWSGHKSRLDRDLTTRFHSDGYALEELTAELGSAFSLARLDLVGEPRPDHASYLSSWLKALRADSRAVVSVAAAAERACKFLFADTDDEVTPTLDTKVSSD